ncbi:tyrosine-type recombinase/integrase [Intestinimonas butyriciproducens]|uniref:tyrosine-type recombinase/integrase n=1 Tax=Intestinimonas butyriciproducens TaxID=1297617 RepID=UPI0019595136|nr:site-specific integrase [Intestinimonas butyriciproducens]MBM6977445.1 site-specific integrase [Intestinimonas butyriciproducens]
MGKRRPSGDGMVRKREDGRWEGRIVVGHKENGDSIFRYVYADTQKELTAKLRQNITTYHGIDLTEESKMVLSEWLDRWLNQMASVLRPGTLEHYRNDLEHHVKPHLGHKRLTQITAVDLRKLYDTLKQRGRVHPHPGESRGLSTTTVHGIHTTLHHALKSAVDQRLLPNNPADHVAPPKVAHKAMNILNDEQLNTFLLAAEQDPIWHDFFYTELTTGLRLGEICGLMWSDFDERKGTLCVRRTLHKEKGGRLVVGNTKTSAGTRSIVLPSSTVELLRLRKKASYSPWIFHNPLHPEAPINPSTAYRQLKKILEENNLPDIRFHDLRHTFATHALANGVDAKTLSSILGHTKASFTVDTYTHTTSYMHQKAAEIVGGFLTDYLGEEMAPWQNAESAATAVST